MEEASVVPDNVRSRGMRETEPSYRGDGKKQARSGGFQCYSIAIFIAEYRRNSFCPGEGFLHE